MTSSLQPLSLQRTLIAQDCNPLICATSNKNGALFLAAKQLEASDLLKKIASSYALWVAEQIKLSNQFYDRFKLPLKRLDQERVLLLVKKHLLLARM